MDPRLAAGQADFSDRLVALPPSVWEAQRAVWEARLRVWSLLWSNELAPLLDGAPADFCDAAHAKFMKNPLEWAELATAIKLQDYSMVIPGDRCYLYSNRLNLKADVEARAKRLGISVKQPDLAQAIDSHVQAKEAEYRRILTFESVRRLLDLFSPYDPDYELWFMKVLELWGLWRAIYAGGITIDPREAVDAACLLEYGHCDLDNLAEVVAFLTGVHPAPAAYPSAQEIDQCQLNWYLALDEMARTANNPCPLAFKTNVILNWQE